MNACTEALAAAKQALELAEHVGDRQHLFMRMVMWRMRLLAGSQFSFVNLDGEARVRRAVTDGPCNVRSGGARRQVFKPMSEGSNGGALCLHARCDGQGRQHSGKLSACAIHSRYPVSILSLQGRLCPPCSIALL